MTGSVTKIEKVQSQEKDNKLSSIDESKTQNSEAKTAKPDKIEEDKLVDIIDNSLQDNGAPENLGSLASIKVIEVKEAPAASEDVSPKSDTNPRRLSVLTSPVEQVLTEKTTVDGTIESFSTKEDVANIEDAISQDIEDIMTLEEVLNKELLNISASGVCWQVSRDKKNVLSMFFVK